MLKSFLSGLCALLLIINPIFSWAGVDFDNVDDFLTCGTADILPENGALTISAWTFHDTGGEGGVGRIIEKGNGGSNRVIFLQQNDGTSDNNEQLRFYDRGTTAMDVLSPAATLSHDVWHHVLMTFTGDVSAVANVTFYIDGIVQTTSGNTGVVPADNSAGT